MIDREKALEGLQELIDYLFHEYKVCYHGDEEDCYNRFLQANNAMNLLKEQEPRVLTIEEVTGDAECWFEHRNGTCGYAKCFMHKASQTVEINRIMSNPEFITLNSFMKFWRCWSARPTEEQRKKMKWDA